MKSLLFIEDIKKYLRFKGVEDFTVDPDKIDLVIGKIERLSKTTGHCTRHLLLAYAFFYVEVFNELNFHKIYIRTNDFIDMYGMELSTALITDEDVNDYLNVEAEWLGMNKFNVNTLPMPVRKILSLKHVMIGHNTTFKYCRNYICFVKIANWINRHRLYYPQLHGYAEFFLHLPAIHGVKEYYPEAFFKPEATLEKYYKQVYGDTPKSRRFDVFFNTLHPSLKKAETFRKSNLISAPDILKRLKAKESHASV